MDKGKDRSASSRSASEETREDRRGEKGVSDAEHRNAWAMAATSVASLIQQFSASKPVPDLDTIKRTFQPSTPKEWLKAQGVPEGGEIEEEPPSVSEDSPSLEADGIRLFFDPSVSADDGLQEFVSDDNLRRASKLDRKPSYFAKRMDMAKRSFMHLGSLDQSPSAQHLQTTEALALGRRQSHLKASVSYEIEFYEEEEAGPSEAGEEVDKKKSAHVQPSQVQLTATESFDHWDTFGLEVPKWDPKSEGESEESQLKVADVDYNINELAKGLESLLEDLRLESRITERYKSKLMNKYNLLLHALVNTHDREYEVLHHLQTKREILNALTSFTNPKPSPGQGQGEEKRMEEASAERMDDMGSVSMGDRQSMNTMGGNPTEPAVDPKKGEEEEQTEEQIMSAQAMRETLLKQTNKLDVFEAIKRIHVLKLKQKEFEKALLTLHYSKMVKPADLNNEIKEVRRLVNELQMEISGIHEEMGQVQMEVRMEEKASTEVEKVLEKLELEALTKQNETSNLQATPILIQKDADREAEKLEQLQDVYDRLCQTQEDSMDDYRGYQEKIDKITSEIHHLVREENKFSSQKKNSVREIERLMTQMEALISREQLMLDRATQMSEKIQQANKNKKKIHDEQQKIYNDASKSLRTANKLERSIKFASEAFFSAKLAHEKMRAAFEAAKPHEEDKSWQRLSRMMEKEIHNLKVQLNKKLEEANIKETLVERLKYKLGDLYDDQIGHGKELQDLIRTTVKKRRERQEKSEQCIKLDAQILKFDLDIKKRELIIQDCNKACTHYARKLQMFHGKTTSIKLERSLVMNEISQNKEKLGQGKRSLRDLEDEVVSIHQRILDLESDLKGKHFYILSARLARDSLRKACFRSRETFRGFRNQKAELRLGNKTYRKEITRQRNDIGNIRKDFEKTMADINDIANKVREKIGEICNFNEYIQTYDRILMKGANEMTIREMERIKLVSLRDELMKHVLIVKLNQPDESAFVTKISTLRKQFEEITETRRNLEQKLNADENPERIREIRFDLMKTKESIPSLDKRLDAIEELLAHRDATGLERTLIENHIQKITDDTLVKAIQLKDGYSTEAKTKVEIRRNLNNLSREIDGLICENSILAAQAETAEMMFLCFQDELAQAETNAEKGLPPTKGMEEEWNHSQWKNEMLRRANMRRNTGGFLRKIQHKDGGQIKAEAFRNVNRKKLEDANASPLGWRFSVVSNTNNRQKSNPC